MFADGRQNGGDLAGELLVRHRPQTGTRAYD